ncbi:uncharacterized protein LOC133205778 [Saccostrea echinata]|uniref:uncharacterized protein LOC133205778 n=1 Tax=Saccostrea echinata TaxID=191078 RepID=UPI002A825BBC|nr:uncharacterized protein LOC133205778 [Saccostrea echinata]
MIEGNTTSIFISRLAILEDAFVELSAAENIRFPLEVTFHGEQAEDFGGPRREFFTIVVREIKERMLDEEINFVPCDERLARQHFFYAGLLLGLSAIQGGPLAPYLHSLLNASETTEKKQFIKGLRRTGLFQLMQGTGTVRFLFHPTATTTLTVNKLLHLLTVNFSCEGSSRRAKEEKTYNEFVKYLRDVYAGRRGDNISLGNVLNFITCVENIPPLGFAITPSLTFVDDAGPFPTAQTCINRIILPSGTAALNPDFLDLAFLNAHFGHT